MRLEEKVNDSITTFGMIEEDKEGVVNEPSSLKKLLLRLGIDLNNQSQ